MKMYIARDEEGCLLLHSEKPSKGYDDLTRKWYWGSMGNSMELDDQMYPEVIFENSPMEVELKLIEK